MILYFVLFLILMKELEISLNPACIINIKINLLTHLFDFQYNNQIIELILI